MYGGYPNFWRKGTDNKREEKEKEKKEEIEKN